MGARADDGKTPMTVRDDFTLVAWDLATVSGGLSEIATTWRRALPSRPDLPLDLPQRLAAEAERLAADALSLAGTGREAAAGLPVSVATRMRSLSADAAYARTLTSGRGDAFVGDTPLWDFLGPALDRAGNRLAGAAA
jgi:hypothetical protein